VNDHNGLPTSGSAAAAVVMLSGGKFLLGCVVVAVIVLVLGRLAPLPMGLLAAEVFATIVGLFLFGSFKYQIHKNALTYGMLLVILATFCGLATSQWHAQIAAQGWWSWAHDHLLSFHGLDELVHADTMLFILGLTFFVAVVAQTRLLEGITFFLLRRYRGAILPTVISVTAVVAFVSGILDGVSMIGLTIRTLVIILMLAAAPTASVRYAVMICTAVTTICGIWLAYGEPPNLIMKANLQPYLNDAFFLRYCAPAAVVTYLVIAWKLRNELGGQRIDLEDMDTIDGNVEDVRFLQASRWRPRSLWIMRWLPSPGAGGWLRKSAPSRWCRLSLYSYGMASITTCRFFSHRLRGSASPLWVLSRFRKCAPWRSGKPDTSTPSTTFSSRCSCRSH
jgi:hypothetical protein